MTLPELVVLLDDNGNPPVRRRKLKLTGRTLHSIGLFVLPPQLCGRSVGDPPGTDQKDLARGVDK